jgi:hypothetical protein
MGMRSNSGPFSPSLHYCTVRAYAVVRITFGLLLLAAAGSKAYQMATAPLLATGIPSARWFLIVIVEFELALGLALIAGLWADALRRIAIGTFSLFAIVGLYQGAIGSGSCGCFGDIAVSPWLVFAIDMSALTAFWRCRPDYRRERHSLHAAAIACSVFVALGAPSAFVMASFNASEILEDGKIIGDNPIVVLAPENWIGTPFPLVKHIDVGRQLATGLWRVVLYHHDCPRCQELVADMNASTDDNHGSRIALIEIPPFGFDSQSASLKTSFVYGHLSPNRDWFVQAPAIIDLAEGIVVRTSD